MKMIFKNSWNMIKSFWFKFFGITFLISFLLFFLNILLGLSFFAKLNADQMKDKLGVFVYLKNDRHNQENKNDQNSERMSKTIELKDKLEKK